MKAITDLMHSEIFFSLLSPKEVFDLVTFYGIHSYKTLRPINLKQIALDVGLSEIIADDIFSIALQNNIGSSSDNLKNSQLAELLRSTEPTIKNHRRKCKSRIKEHLERKFPDYNFANMLHNKPYSDDNFSRSIATR